MDSSAPTIPERIAFLLHAVRTLLAYGQHLAATVRHRATNPHFNVIAACFGTANLTTIVARLNRGILRAQALQRVLLARAAAGQDIDLVPSPPPAPAEAEAAPPAEPRPTLRRLPRPVGRNDPELFMPTLQDLERQARRRKVGRTVLDICLDLAVVPGFCTGEFWNELSAVLHHFGGSVVTLMQQKSRREQAFAREQDRIRGSNWDWVRMKRDQLRQVLGFFIGEQPMDPSTPEAAIATGPP